AYRQVGYGEHRERRAERFLGRPRSREAASDVEVLVGREIVLQRARMPDVDELARILLAQPPDGRAAPAHFALRRRQQPAQDAQQARLAAAVGPGDAQQLTARERERHAAKERPSAP